MVLCVVDDLMFSIKISTAAKALGAPVFFERNAAAVIDRVREKQPALVIFDLNSQKLRPLDAIAALKADPSLQQIPTLGYVSHVQTDLIQAARDAGIDQVLARSAFTERLGEILTTGGTSREGQAPPAPPRQ
jgi:CheY-like chemotaxis protein